MRFTISLALCAASLAATASAGPVLTSTRLFATPTGSAAEIPAYDRRGGRLFLVSPSALTYYDALSGAPLGMLDYLSVFPGSAPNSVAIQGNWLAVALEASAKTDPGRVLVYDLRDLGKAPRSFTVGALPDMLTFTPDGRRILVANEGEPNSYGLPTSVDPEGSVSIIDLKTGTVATAGFGGFDKATLQAAGVRIFGPGATVAQDLEPEYIALSKDGKTALVTLQENNAVAIVDIETATVTSIRSMGFKDFRVGGPNTIDPNDQDTGYIPRQRDGFYALYQPDGIARFTVGGQDYFITANEGDARDWANVGGPGVNSDLARAGAAFAPFNRIEVIRPALWGSAVPADASLITIGGRSFSILDATGAMVYDSGNVIEDLVASGFPANRDNGRDDNKGAEPEDVKIGRINGRTIAFIGLERANGRSPGLVLAFDLTGWMPGLMPTFLGGISDAALGRPEGLVFWQQGGRAFLGVADEETSNLAVFELFLTGVPAPSAVALFGLGALGLAAARHGRRRA